MMAEQGDREAARPVVAALAATEVTRRRMQRVRRRDTSCESRLRSILHGRGLRYRVDQAIPGAGRARPDLIFRRARVAVFVDGCFWHSCPLHGSIPRNNRSWWIEKLDANVERDRRHDRELSEAGWLVIRIWEHEDPVSAAARVEAAVAAHR